MVAGAVKSGFRPTRSVDRIRNESIGRSTESPFIARSLFGRLKDSGPRRVEELERAMEEVG